MVAGHARSALCQGSHDRRVGDRLSATGSKLRQGLVEQERRQHDAARSVGNDPRGLAVEGCGISLEPGQIGVGIGCALDLVLAVEEVGDLDKRAGVLRNHIGRVAV